MRHSITASTSASLVLLLLKHPPTPTPTCSSSSSRRRRLILFQRKPPSFSCLISQTASSPFPQPLRCTSSQSQDSLDESEDLSEDGVCIEIQKLPNNSRRIISSVSIDAPLHAVWNVLTDYERLADFIPGLALCQLLDTSPNYARLFQIGQQNLAFGLKFNARGILDCYEKPLETLPSGGLKRDIEFNMVEGDFQLFQGKWSILQGQVDRGGRDDDSSIDQQMQTNLSYLVDVKPKLWLPVQLVEPRLCKEIKVNLACIRDEAHKALRNTLHTL